MWYWAPMIFVLQMRGLAGMIHFANHPNVTELQKALSGNNVNWRRR